VDPVLKAQGLMRGERPDREEQIRREANALAFDSAQIETEPKLTVLLSNGTILDAQVKKFSAPLLTDVRGKPLPDAGRDLALLRVPDGAYPAIGLAMRDSLIGDSLHIIGFPGVVLSHELLNKSATLDASVTNGSVSGIKQDAIGQDIIQTDAAAGHGNSGGPAIGDDSRLIGVLTFVSVSESGNQVQGFNFLIPARDVNTFLQGTGVRPGESRFNQVWMAAVQLLLGERFSAAVAKLDEVNALLPDLVGPGRGRVQGEEPAAPAVPVGVGHAGCLAAERGRLRRHVRAAVVAQPLPHPARPGDRRDRERRHAGAARRPHADRLRDEPVATARGHPPGAGGRGRRDLQAGRPARADDRHLLHDA
jgi:Trypsin-like peptidase domain